MPRKFHKPLLLSIAIIGLVSGLILGESNWKPVAQGIPDSGPLITWSLQISKLTFSFLALLMLGKLITLTFFITTNDLRKSLNQISARANLLVIISIVVAITQMAYVLGLKPGSTLTPATISTYLFDLTSSRGYLISAVLALVIALLSLFVKSDNSLIVLILMAGAVITTPLLNSHSASLGDHSLALTSSITHGLAVSIWVGTLIALLPHISKTSQELVTKFGALAKWCVVALGVSGIAATYSRLDSISDFWMTGYGRLVIVKFLLFMIALAIAGQIRKQLRSNISVTKFISIETIFLSLAIGFGVALQNTALSRSGISFETAAEEILGFEFPPVPGVAEYLFGWHPEWILLTLSTIALILYLSAAQKLKRQEIKWPGGRTTSFVIGIALLAWTSSSGIAKYAMISFSAHMIQHMVLSMIAPIFLVLGAPVTLALRALPTQSNHETKNARDWILSLLESKYAKLVTHPISVLIIFTFGLYGMYFTSLFGDLMRSHSGHVFMEIHFLFSGFLFAFMTVGIDPAPRKIPYWSKLMMVLMALGLHTFFALAIMQSRTPVGESWYAQVQPPWIFDLLKENYIGGGIAWAIGEIPTLMLAILVAVQWARSDERTANRLDRAAQRDGDQERKEYNERLARLNSRDQNN